MKKKALIMIPALLLGTMAFYSCSSDDDEPVNRDNTENTENTENGKDSSSDSGEASGNDTIGGNGTLVVYFSAELPSGVDATSGATNVYNERGKRYGANQYLAVQIAEKTQADTARLTTAKGYYPIAYSDLATFARNEKDNNIHPALTTREIDLNAYSNIIISTPVWWYTIPMPLYSFLDKYDLGGKNVFVATTHAGSGLADAISVISREEPDAKVSNNGLAVNASNVREASSLIDSWLKRVGLIK